MSTTIHQRAIKRPQVQQETGLSRSTIYAKINPHSSQYDPTFPKPIKLGVRSIAWIESEVQAWISSRRKVGG